MHSFLPPLSLALILAATVVPLVGAAPPFDPSTVLGAGVAQGRPAAGLDTVVTAWTGSDLAWAGTRAPVLTLNRLFVSEFVGIPETIFTYDVPRDNAKKWHAQGVEYLPSMTDGTWKVDGERMTLIWRIKARSWHDGKPVTCGDYVFSHIVARNRQVSIFRDRTNRIANVSCPEGPGGTKIVVAWKERDGYANLGVTEYGALPRHALEPFYRANPSRLGDAPYGMDPKATVGDGAYRLVEWKRGVSLTVESVGRHPIFGEPAVRRIVFRFLPDISEAARQLLAGLVDISVISPGTFAAEEGQFVDRFQVQMLFGDEWDLSVLGPTSDCDGLYTSDGIPREANGWTSSNYPGYRNQEMDRVCKAIRREVDPARRTSLLHQSARIFARDLSAIPLYYPFYPVAVKRGLKNWNFAAASTVPWNAHKWVWE